MACKLLQIDFKMNGPWGEEMATEFKELACLISDTEGLLWKIWTENEQSKEAGGIYLFTDALALDKYLTEHTARLKGFGIQEIHVKIFDVNEPLTKITRGI